MSLVDYMKGSGRASTGSVELQQADIHVHVKEQQLALVEVLTFGISYVVKLADQCRILWTVDEHGNPRRPSVFKLSKSIPL